MAPLTAATGALADGLTTVSDGIASFSEQDPSGLSTVLAETVGQPQEGYTNDQEGLVGVVSNLSQGLAEGAEETPLDPVVDPLAQTLGYSEEDGTDGVASGLSSVGDTLAADESQLSPLTSEILAPIVGTDEESGGSTGLSGTLDETGEGLTDLTNEDSALAPLDPATSAVSDMVVSALSSGISDGGDAIIDNSEMAGPGEELITTVGTLLGGESTPDTEEPPPEEGGTTGTPLDVVLDPLTGALDGGGETPETPLSPLTDALMDNSDPAVFAENVAGVIDDVGANTPLEAVTDPISDALSGGGDDTGGGDTGGTTGTPLDVVLDPLAEAVAGGGDDTGGTTGTPLDAVLDPLAEAAMGGGDTAPVDDLLGMADGTPISTVTDPLQDAISPLTGGLG